MVLTLTCRHGMRRGPLPWQKILARRGEEWRSVLLRPRDLLTAYFFTRGRETRRVATWSHTPWRQGAVLGQRWWRRSMSHIACSWQRARQREGRCGKASNGTDELGDAVQPILIEVVDQAVAQELACHEWCGLRVRGSATSVRQ